MRNTNKLTFAALCCGLSIALLYIGSLVQTGTLAIFYAVGLSLMMTVSKSGISLGFISYIAAGLLSIFILPDKSLAISYLVFFGSIPLLKYFAEKTSRVVEWIIKTIFINIFICGIYFIFRSVLATYPIPIIIPWGIAFIAGIVYDLLLGFGFTFIQRYFNKTT